METLKPYVKTVERISEGLGWLSQMIVPITIIVGFANVVLRYIGQFVGLKLTSNVLIEAQWYLYTLIFFLGFAYILKNQINVRVDFWFAEQPEKRKAWIDFVGHMLALLPFCVLALYVTWNPVMTSWGRLPDGSFGNWELSPDPNGLPRAPIKSMILVAFGSLFLQGTAEVIKLIAILRGKKDIYKKQLVELEAPIRIE